MKRSGIRLVALIGHALSCLATLIILFIASGGGYSGETLFFSLLVLSPYVIFAAVNEALYRRCKSLALPIASAVVSLLFVLLTVGVYYPSILWDPSSTVAIIFLFLPLWLCAMGASVLVLTWLIAWGISRLRQRPTEQR